MSGDIITFLHLDKELPDGRAIVAKELKGCSSSFITSTVLGHSVKHKLPTLLILTHYPLSHYQNVGLRMFYNLKKSIESGYMDNHNLAEEYVNAILENRQISLDETLNNIKQKIKTMQDKFGTVNVIIDGVSNLFDLGYNLREVNMFCRELIKAVRGFPKSFVLLSTSESNEEDVTHSISNLLSHMAYTVLEVESLSSGWSAEVSGHLTVRHPGQKFEDEHVPIIDQKPSQYLFKLFDKGVKLFAPGTVV